MQNSKTGHHWLREMIKVRNNQQIPGVAVTEISNRANFIINALKEIGCDYQLDYFNLESPGREYSSAPSGKFVNIIVKFDATNPLDNAKPTIAFCAHHDVRYTDSENCQDNSASVCNLLDLSSILHLKKNNSTPVIIIFLDLEERGFYGADNFSRKINKGDFGDIENIINLELTGLGDKIYLEKVDYEKGKIKKPDFLFQRLKEKTNNCFSVLTTPQSDAMRFRINEISSQCIGLLPADEIAEDAKKKTWALCHRVTDTIEKTSEKDMSDFVDVLEYIVILQTK